MSLQHYYNSNRRFFMGVDILLQLSRAKKINVLQRSNGVCSGPVGFPE
jgi:hypothetical protein